MDRANEVIMKMVSIFTEIVDYILTLLGLNKIEG